MLSWRSISTSTRPKDTTRKRASTSLSLERNPRLPRNVAQVLDHRKNQRHSILSPHLFRFALRIAWNQRTFHARRRLRRAKRANVVVDLALEFVRVNKSVNAHRSKEMPDALAHAALRNLLP